MIEYHYFLLSDHLGSTGIVTFENGNLVSQTKYKAWGDVRHQSGPLLTEYTYTGQYSYAQDFGLMYYSARWYDPALGRFAQADSIVPPGVQGLDRYAYVNNSPMNYVDPSGHSSCEGEGHWDDGPECAKRIGSRLNIDIQVRTYMNHHDLKNLFPKATGSNLEFNVTLGIPLKTQTNGTAFLLYFSVGIVSDNRGDIQVYYTTLDQKYIPGGGGFVSEPGKDNGAYGVSASLTKGLIYGEGFTSDKFIGKGYASTLPAGPLPASVGVFGPQDPTLNYTGYEFGPSGGFSMGDVYTDTKKIIDINLSHYIDETIAIPVCRAMLGLCGAP